MPDRMVPLSGRVRDVRVPTLLQFLRREGKTGVLNFDRNDLQKSIYLQEGDIIFAASLYPDDRLGEMLLKTGKISFKQYETSTEILKRTGKRQGTILVEQGFITPKELFEGVLLQVKEIVLSLFTWIDGDYLFREGPLLSEEVVTLNISTADLILDGIKRIRDWNRLIGEMPLLDSPVRVASDPRNLFQKVGITPAMKGVMELADGKRTLYEILAVTPPPSLECAQILYFLLSIQMLEVASPGSQSPSPPERERPPEKEESAAGGEPASAEPLPASPEMPAGAAPSAEGRLEEEGMAIREVLLKKKEKEAPWSHEKIREAFSLLESQNHYQVLNVPVGASREEIKRAYFRLAKEYHPDRHFEAGMTEFKRELHTLFNRITEAYDTLVMERKRKGYDGQLSAGKIYKGEVPRRGLRPQEFFARGEVALKGGDLRNALYFFMQAIEGMPEKPEKAVYYLRHGQTLARVPGKLREAERSLMQAATLDPANVECYLELGAIYAKAGLTEKAISAFSRVLQRDPSNQTARKEIDRLRS